MDSHSITAIGFKNIDDLSRELPQYSNTFEDISSGSDRTVSSPVTPKSDSISLAFDFVNRGSDASSDSSYSKVDSDSEAEAFYSSLNYQLVSSDGECFDENPMSYGELMKRFVQCEEELKTKSLRLEESEIEIENLKDDNMKMDYALFLAEGLRPRLEREKSRVFELQKQVVDLEIKLEESEMEIENLKGENEKRKTVISRLHATIEAMDTEVETETRRVFELRKEVSDLGDELEMSRKCLVVSDADISKLKEINALKTTLASRDEQAEKQRHTIAEGEEEKREVIRQLCFSLDHYKREYMRLLKFLSSNNKKKQGANVVV